MTPSDAHGGTSDLPQERCPVAGFLDQLSDLELTELPLESEVEELHSSHLVTWAITGNTGNHAPKIFAGNQHLW